MNIFRIYLMVIVFMPIIVYGSDYYIIEDVPDIGDDGLRVYIDRSLVNNNISVKQDNEDITMPTHRVERNGLLEDDAITQFIFQTIGLAGVVFGSLMYIASTPIPLFTTTPTTMYDHILSNLMGVFVKRKNQRRWGTVFDVDTKRPIMGARITIFDTAMKQLDVTYSNKDGRYGFLANVGSYKMEVYKKNYEMCPMKNEDPIYGKMYDGGEITVTDNSVLHINIAMQSMSIDWKNYAKNKISEYGSLFSLVKKYLFTVMYFVGFFTTIIIAMLYPSIINIGLVGLNSFFFLSRYMYGKRDYGVVMTVDKKPVPFAIIKLYANEKKVAFAIADVIGRYYILVDNGTYLMHAVGQDMNGKNMNVQYDIKVSNGIVDNDIMLS